MYWATSIQEGSARSAILTGASCAYRPGRPDRASGLPGHLKGGGTPASLPSSRRVTTQRELGPELEWLPKPTEVASIGLGLWRLCRHTKQSPLFAIPFQQGKDARTPDESLPISGEHHRGVRPTGGCSVRSPWLSAPPIGWSSFRSRRSAKPQYGGCQH